jgi:hypothetical protein
MDRLLHLPPENSFTLGISGGNRVHGFDVVLAENVILAVEEVVAVLVVDVAQSSS